MNNFIITKDYNNAFRVELEGLRNPEDIFQVLAVRHADREACAGRVRFWEREKKAALREFDHIFQCGVAYLAQRGLELEGAPLAGRIDRPAEVKDGVRRIEGVLKGGVGFGVGCLLGYYGYTVPMANLIIHENGHAWAWEHIYAGGSASTSTNAGYWLERRQWWNYFHGVREGGPGNVTRFMLGEGGGLTPFGKSLTENQRSLMIIGGGLGAELALNTLIGLMGVLAIKGKRRVLGGSLLGFALVAHSAAHSYIRRGPTCAGDPPQVAQLIANELHIPFKQAWDLLNVGYYALPIIVLGALALSVVGMAPDVPEEIVLMRMLMDASAESPEAQALYRELVELEIEMHSEKQALKAMGNTHRAWRKKRLFQGKLFKRLQERVQGNRLTRKLFNQTRATIEKEIKGEIAPKIPLTHRARVIVGLCAYLAYSLMQIAKAVIHKVTPLLQSLVGIFIGLQVVCTLLDIARMVADLRNDALSTYAKTLSVLSTLITLLSATLITLALFTTALTPLFLPVLIASTLLGFTFAYLKGREIQHLAKVAQETAVDPWLKRKLQFALHISSRVTPLAALAPRGAPAQ